MDDSLKGTKSAVEIDPEFSFNDMKDLFKPTLLLKDSHFKPAVAYFFDAHRDLVQEVESLVRNTDIHRWPYLEQACFDYIAASKQLDFSEYILGQPSVRIGDKKGDEFDAEMIENHEGDIKFQFSNSKNAYIALYWLVKRSVTFISEYKELSAAVNSCGQQNAVADADKPRG